MLLNHQKIHGIEKYKQWTVNGISGEIVVNERIDVYVSGIGSDTGLQ
jgi:hypothetical protein